MLSRLIRRAFGESTGTPGERARRLVDAGNEHARAGRHDEALACYDGAIALVPDDAGAHNNRSLSLFALGRTAEAWTESEWRFQVQETTRRFHASPPVPRWHGGPLGGGTLLVLWEQGLGDVLQHLRFLPLAAARAGRAAFLCPAPLCGLVRHSFPGIDVVEARKGRPPEWARHAAFVPLLSLPQALGTDWDALPSEPYLSVPGEAAPKRAGEREIGIVWRTSGDEPHRDCPLDEMLRLARPGIALVALQFRPSPDEAAALERAGVPVRTGDFVETAAIVRSLDAVVSVDTAMVHLAGGLGHPVHALLNEPYSVRWTMQGERSRWYPSLRLHRKRRDAPWREAVASAAAALAAG